MSQFRGTIIAHTLHFQVGRGERTLRPRGGLRTCRVEEGGEGEKAPLSLSHWGRNREKKERGKPSSVYAGRWAWDGGGGRRCCVRDGGLGKRIFGFWGSRDPSWWWCCCAACGPDCFSPKVVDDGDRYFRSHPPPPLLPPGSLWLWWVSARASVTLLSSVRNGKLSLENERARVSISHTWARVGAACSISNLPPPRGGRVMFMKLTLHGGGEGE